MTRAAAHVPGEDNSGQGFDIFKPTYDRRGTAVQGIKNELPTSEQFAPQAQYDEQYRQMQQQALDQLSREATMGGWTPEERASYQRQAAQSAGIAMGQRAGMAQRMIAKGLPPSVANQVAGEVGQQSQSQAGYMMGTAAQMAANERARDASMALAGLGNQMGQQGLEESEFNAGQGLRGVLKRYAEQMGQDYDQQLLSDVSRAQTTQGLTQAGVGFVGIGRSLASGRGDGGGGGGGGGSKRRETTDWGD